MEIRKIDLPTEHGGLDKNQKVRLLLDFYDGADCDEDRKPIHRKEDVGVIDGFGVICGQEVVTVEICHHGRGTFVVAPFRPSDIELVPAETPLTQPDKLEDPDDTSWPDGQKPVILIDITKID